jgi:hypothetical protein
MVKRHLIDDLEDMTTSTPKRRHSPAPSVSSTPIKNTPDKANQSMCYSQTGGPNGVDVTPAKHLVNKLPRTPRFVWNL